jgi:hypothetical protein
MIRSADARSAIRGLGISDQRFRIRDEGFELANVEFQQALRQATDYTDYTE